MSPGMQWSSRAVNRRARTPVSPRRGRHGGIGLEAAFRCGLREDDGNQTRFGYRHVFDEHEDDYFNLSWSIGRNWRDMADFAMHWTLKDPDLLTSTGPTRFCYERRLALILEDNTLRKFTNVVILGQTGRRIMTAFPGYQNYCRSGRQTGAIVVVENAPSF